MYYVYGNTMPNLSQGVTRLVTFLKKNVAFVVLFPLVVMAVAPLVYEYAHFALTFPEQPPKNFVFNTADNTERRLGQVLGVDQGSLSFSTRNEIGGTSNGGVLVLSAGEKPELFLQAWSLMGQGRFELYPVSSEDLLNYLSYRPHSEEAWRDLDRIYTIDTSQLPDPLAFDVTLRETEKTSTTSKSSTTPVELPVSGTGIWFLKGEINGASVETMVIRSDLASIVHTGDNEIIFWAQDSGYQSVSGAQVELLSLNGGRNNLGTLVTNEQGLATTGARAGIDIALVKKGNDVTLIPVDLKNMGWSSTYSAFSRHGTSSTSFLFTDRFLYKPGDTVFFKAIVREHDDAQFAISPRTVGVSVENQTGVIWEGNGTIDQLGTVTGAIPLSKDASLDEYWLEITDGDRTLASQWFEVAEYRKPDATLDVSTDKLAYLPGETVTFQVSGEYFLGQPSAHQEVRWKIYQKPSGVRGSYETLSFYERTDFYGSGSEEPFREGTLTLDEKGRAEITLPAENSTGGRQFWQIQLELLDAGSTAAYDEMRVLIQPGDFVMELDTKNDPEKIVRQPFQYPLKLYANKPGVNLGGIKVRGVLSVKKEGSETYVVERGNFSATSSENGELTFDLTLQENPGSYKFTAEAYDRSGNPITLETTFYSQSASTSKPDKKPLMPVKVTLDKEEYRPGETARITVEVDPSVKNLFVSLGRNYSRLYRVLPVTEGKAVFETVVPEQYQPNFYVYAGSFFEGTWRSTVKDVDVNTADKELTIDIQFSKEEYGPAETAEAEITVTDGLGNPVQADVAFWLFDKALLELHGVYFSGIFKHFWYHRWFGMQTNHSFEGIYSSSAEMGGGGGGADRSVFKDTAYWNPHVTTGVDGKAVLSFELPDNLTTWVAAAVANTSKTQVGDALTEVTVSKDVVVRPILPNFLRTGDQFVLSSMLYNFTDQTEDFSVTARFAEGKVDEDAQRATISAGNFERFSWPTNLGSELRQAEFSVRAEGIGNSDLRDQVTQVVPVYEYGFDQAYTRVLPSGGYDAIIQLDDGIDWSRSTGQLVIQPFRYGASLEALLSELLRNSDYGSNDDFAGSLIAASLYKEYGARISYQYSESELNKHVAQALENLADNQDETGVWGTKYSSGFHVNPYLSAFVIEALVSAREAGFSVDPTMIDRSLAYFRDWRPSTLEHQTIQQYVFSLFPDENLERKQISLAKNTSLPRVIFAQAMLANSRQGFTDSPETVRQFVEELSYQSPTQLVWQDTWFEDQHFLNIFHPTRLAVRAMLATGVETEKIEKSLDYLYRNFGPYESTREGSLAHQALATIEYMEKTGQFSPDYQYEVLFNGESLTQGRIAPTTPLSGRVEVALPEPLPEKFRLAVQQTGQGGLYSRLESSNFVTDRELWSDGNHLQLYRRYLNPRKEKAPLKPGDLVIVQFDVYGLGKGEQAIEIEDYLPAGLVAVDESFIGGRFDGSGVNTGCVRRELTKQGMRLTFCSSKDSGTYSYKARVVSEGVFAVPPATVRLTGDPSIWARTRAETLPINGQYTLDLLEDEIVSETSLWPLAFASAVAVGVVVFANREKILTVLRKLRNKRQDVQPQPGPEPSSGPTLPPEQESPPQQQGE